MSDASITLIELSIKLILFICFMTLFSQRREGIKSIHMLCQVLKSVSTRKPGRTRQEVIQLESPGRSNFAQMLGLVRKWYRLWQKLGQIFYSFKLGGSGKNGHLILTYAYLISHLRFSISTTRKAM